MVGRLRTLGEGRHVKPLKGLGKLFLNLSSQWDIALTEKDKKSVEETRDRLKLNDDRYVNVRSRWLELYCTVDLTFSGLKKTLHLSRMS
jgi:hypothetical protein